MKVDLALADIGLPKDVIVVTPEDVKRHGGVPGTVIYEALRHGKILYERPGLQILPLRKPRT